LNITENQIIALIIFKINKLLVINITNKLQNYKSLLQKLILMLDNVEYILLQDIDHFNIVQNLLDPNYRLAKLILQSLRSDTNIIR